jgi:alpha-L-fucosidase
VGKGEWVMENDKLPIAQYAKLATRFKPDKFDAVGWVKLAKSAGAKYITFTTKHHDGFCMFGSKLTDYDIVDATPYKADPFKALADACRDQHIKLFAYYSLLDWHHGDYFPLGKTGATAGRAPKGDWKRYVAYYQGQVRELCTNYGEIGGFWFDGWWDRPEADWDLAGTYRMIHALQPEALVGNNHHAAPHAGEDFQMFEQDLPGENAAGFNKAAVAGSLPLETCLTINRSWGYNARDTSLKTVDELVRCVVGAAGRGSNLLLNVGPRPDGTISPEFTERLLGLGKWLSTYGDSVYGTRKGPISPQVWGVSTAKGPPNHPQEIYLHILDFKNESPITFDPSLAWTPHLFGKSAPVTLTRAKGELRLEIPKEARHPIDTIIVMRPRSSGR